jgi:hypothetical protein
LLFPTVFRSVFGLQQYLMIEGPTAMQVYLPSQNAVLKNQFIALVLPRQSFDLALFTRPENGRSYLLPLLTIKIFIENS